MEPKKTPPERALDEMLREWRVDASLPAGFTTQVWRRIARAPTASEAGVWATLWRWLTEGAVSPAGALGCVAALLLAGGAGGYWQSNLRAEREAQLHRFDYVRSVDPFFQRRLP